MLSDRPHFLDGDGLEHASQGPSARCAQESVYLGSIVKAVAFHRHCRREDAEDAVSQAAAELADGGLDPCDPANRPRLISRSHRRLPTFAGPRDFVS